MAEWFSIEVFDGSFAARAWAEAFGDSLVQAAMWHAATDWEWHYASWGVVLELQFEDELVWGLYRDAAAVKAALDSVPDPVNGLIMKRGRGGSSGSANPRLPRPLAGSGAAVLPIPEDEPPFELSEARFLAYGPASLAAAPAGCERQAS